VSGSPISGEHGEALDLLLRYALRGLRVVPLNGLDGAGNCECQPWRDKKKKGPCPTPGKHPRLRKWQELATTDATIIRKWHKSYPRANWGIATGRGVFVLDNDPRHGGDDSLAVLVSRHGPLDDTLQALTGGGGSHRYYSVPSGVIIPNDVAFMPGLDVRVDGGQVVVPPSLHKSGNRYQWDGLAGFDATITPAPAWLLHLLGVGGEKTPGKAAVIPETIRDGEKHTMCVSLAGSMRRRGCNSEEIYAALLKLSERFESRVPPENLRAIAEDIEGRYAPAATYANSTATRNSVNFAFTDTGNAERLVAVHGNDLRFCADMKKWGTWDGRRWVFQDSRRVKALAKRTMRLMYVQAADIEDKELREAAEKHARKSESAAAINAMLSCAEYEDGILVAPDELDTNAYSLNFLNGTVDLRTGALRPHLREDLITKLIH
jgi:putative DNA primase/helicase